MTRGANRTEAFEREPFCKSTAHFYPERIAYCRLMPEAKSGMLQASAISHLVGAATANWLHFFVRGKMKRRA